MASGWWEGTEPDSTSERTLRWGGETPATLNQGRWPSPGPWERSSPLGVTLIRPHIPG